MKSLAKMFMIIDCFSRSDRELALADISERTGIAKPTARRLLSSMQKAGYVEQARRRKGYSLGIKFFEIGSMVLDNMEINRVARPIVNRLQQISGETVHLCVFNGFRPVMIARRQMDVHPLNTITTIESAPAYCTGVGKVALAFQEPAVIQKVIDDGLRRYTDNTITDEAWLRTELVEIRRCGYSIDNAEHQPDVRCVAAPVRNSSGAVIGSISVSTVFERLPDDRIPALSELVVSSADEISSRLGWEKVRPHEKSRL
jgi:DNA-binding IclR family transcriptional regulator